MHSSSNIIESVLIKFFIFWRTGLKFIQKMLFFAHYSIVTVVSKMVRLRKGIGAKCSVSKRVMHPQKKISEHPTYFNLDKIDNLLITGKGEEKVKTGRKCVIYFRHDDFPNITLYCSEKFAKVTTEGPESSLFAPPPSSASRTSTSHEGEHGNSELDQQREMIPDNVFYAAGCSWSPPR